jgi:hypothetical protein
MKPLELTVYPLDERMDLAAKACRLMKAKRFTDAELAAEAFREKSMRLSFLLHAKDATGGGEVFWLVSADKANERLLTLNRFATLPHYDEVRS